MTTTRYMLDETDAHFISSLLEKYLASGNQVTGFTVSGTCYNEVVSQGLEAYWYFVRTNPACGDLEIWKHTESEFKVQEEYVRDYEEGWIQKYENEVAEAHWASIS